MTERVCSVVGCGIKYLAKDLCQKHYYRLARYGRLELLPTGRSVCRLDGCKSFVKGNELCERHYMKLRKTGTLEYRNLKGEASRQKAKDRAKTWRKKNWPRYLAYLQSCKSRVKRVTPKWADMEAIRLFYQNRPEGHHVDHIIPINGKHVTGLHVLENLQYLPALENLRKSNKVSAT